MSGALTRAVPPHDFGQDAPNCRRCGLPLAAFMVAPSPCAFPMETHKDRWHRANWRGDIRGPPLRMPP